MKGSSGMYPAVDLDQTARRVLEGRRAATRDHRMVRMTITRQMRPVRATGNLTRATGRGHHHTERRMANSQ